MSFLYKVRQILQNARHLYRYPPGHFYSPLPDLKEVGQRSEEIFSREEDIKEIDLNSDGQLQLLSRLSTYAAEMPAYGTAPKNGLRFHFGNGFFEEGDASVLYSFLRHFKPKKVVEVGSGFSSALMLDTVEKFRLDTRFVFIEPFPQRLYSLLQDQEELAEVKVQGIQACKNDLFEALEADDFLFVDSSHVLKTGSDLHDILFRVLPLLKKGVIIHFHDIFYPFEYPKNWVDGGRAWNEAYALRAFLSHNQAYEVLFFNDYMGKKHLGKMNQALPLFKKNFGGGLWLRKLV